ncbi:YcaO-like family protein [Nocardiopsis sp. RSe5-2]|uniref:YcaO-like family protein n=1 Tax=Nocardiopsis endophytica TaxID=3018445 RepID=A0ABT4U1W2_9ACTN|nr:YcaO-like family protein [Nocardiopsis endophytica]MDA2810915.1 YcaO-like family protein [Nocardiopsis endophytica]
MKTWPILAGTLFLATHRGPAETAVGGACDTDPERAAARAEAEYTERTALIENGPGLLRRRADLLGGGVPTIAPVPALDDEEWWLPGTALGGAGPPRPAAVPAITSLLKWTDGRPLRWKQSSVGTAAHPDPAVAAETALLETLERHAVRRVWHGTARLEAVDAHLEPALPEGVRAELDRAGLAVRVWRIHDDLPVSAVLAAVLRRDKEQITFGACARRAADLRPAVRHAVCEAVSVRAALANASSDPAEVARPREMARRQNDFLDHLSAMEVPVAHPADPAATADLGAAVARRFGADPVAADLSPREGPPVVRVVIPHPEFLLPADSESRYALSPGYIE